MHTLIATQDIPRASCSRHNRHTFFTRDLPFPRVDLVVVSSWSLVLAEWCGWCWWLCFLASGFGRSNFIFGLLKAVDKPGLIILFCDRNGCGIQKVERAPTHPTPLSIHPFTHQPRHAIYHQLSPAPRTVRRVCHLSLLLLVRFVTRTCPLCTLAGRTQCQIKC